MKNLMYRAHAELFTLRQKAQDLLKNKSGASMIEYAILIGLITAAVIGTSVILPVLGPILFLCMPTRVESDVTLEGQFEAPQEVQNTGAQDLAAAGLAGSGLSLSAGQKGGAATAAQVQAAVYRRGDTEFNRQFFERSFPQFFRLTRSDADKDAVLSVRSSKGEVVATRISRISSNEPRNSAPALANVVAG